MDRLIMWVLPAEFRTSHGDELIDMLDSSARPIRDRADVVVAGVGLRLGRATRPLLVVAVVGVVGSGFALVHAIANLRHGVTEVADHWWSMFIAAGVACSLFSAIVLSFAQRRAGAWTSIGRTV